MLIRTRCEHCQTVAELSKVHLGKAIICSQCGGQYVAREEEEEVDDGVIGLAMEEADVQTGAAEVKTGGRLSRHSLKLPPPPPEDWNLTGDEDGETVPGQRFAPFRPRRKELEPFLDREHAGDDNAVLLILGLIGFALLATVCFVLLIILCIVV
jgi:hypothetical protein